MNGWVRVGCVLVVLWFIGWAGLGYYEWQSISEEDWGLCRYVDDAENLRFVVVDYDPDGLIGHCYKYISSNYWIVGILFPAIAWLSVLSIIGAWRWVAEGFKNKGRHQGKASDE